MLNAGGDGPLYPELRQTVVSWRGYFFWADIPNFTFPIRLLDIDPIDTDSNEGINLLRTLYNREWKFGQEVLWELVIVPGVEGKFCIVCFIHHLLADGFSTKKLINKVSQPPIVGKIKPSSPARRSTIVSLVIFVIYRYVFGRISKYFSIFSGKNFGHNSIRPFHLF